MSVDVTFYLTYLFTDLNAQETTSKDTDKTNSSRITYSSPRIFLNEHFYCINLSQSLNFYLSLSCRHKRFGELILYIFLSL